MTALAFLSRPLTKWLLVILMVSGALGAIYIQGYRASSERYQRISVEKELGDVKKQLLTEKLARIADAARAKADRKEMVSLETSIQELEDYAEALEDRDNACLSGPDTERLLRLWD